VTRLESVAPSLKLTTSKKRTSGELRIPLISPASFGTHFVAPNAKADYWPRKAIMECSLGMWRNGLEFPGSEFDGSEHAVCFALGYNVGKVQIKVSAPWQTGTSAGQIKGCVPGTGC
jgi:hypothetical protein